MNKVEVKICFGTLCHVMGGSELQLLEESLPDDLKGRVEIKGSPCLDLCNKPNHGLPPFATVNGRTIGGCTVQSLIGEIYNEINK